MFLNEFGMIIQDEWSKTERMREYTNLDECVVMPNHFHGIIILNCRGVLQYAPTYDGFKSPAFGIGAIVRGLKSAVATRVNHQRNTPGYPVWQRNYYERIIRNETELGNIRKYILENPVKWTDDKYYRLP